MKTINVQNFKIFLFLAFIFYCILSNKFAIGEIFIKFSLFVIIFISENILVF